MKTWDLGDLFVEDHGPRGLVFRYPSAEQTDELMALTDLLEYVRDDERRTCAAQVEALALAIRGTGA